MLIDFLTLWILDAQVGEQQRGFFEILQHGATAPDAPLMTDEPVGDETAEPSNREFIDEADKFVEEFVVYSPPVRANRREYSLSHSAHGAVKC